MKSDNPTAKNQMKVPLMAGRYFSGGAYLQMYATDASAYRELPYGVAFPEDPRDIRELIRFAKAESLSLIPRGAGTSLAGQVVGNGIVTDVSRHMNRVLEINPAEGWVRVEPGVVLDELNLVLKPYKLFFAPETSTSNRCVIGGMIGNNSSGLRSLIYQTTREHLISVNCILSDGSDAVFGPLTKAQFQEKCSGTSLESRIYQHIHQLLSDPKNRQKIRDEFPDPGIVRRNTGYALDELIKSDVFDEECPDLFNFSSLIAGSEGTLAFITEAKLRIVPLPPPVKALVCVHVESVKEAIRGNLIALQYKPSAVELMDDKILALTRENIEQRKNRFFVKGDPGAILIIEFSGNSSEEIEKMVKRLEEEFRNKGIGYHFPLITGADIKKVWNLRKAGLGVLSNLPGDARPVSVIEDTSVHPAQLEAYIDEFNRILNHFKLDCVYHAHISVGELHLRPILDLKKKEDVELFHSIALETAKLVKKYRGSLSGEHGDGRLRGEFIPIMVGEEIYQWFRELKHVWDPHKLFNPGKITDTPPMHTSLRYVPGSGTRDIPTIFDFSDSGGLLRAVERCNGSADCRKSELMGGTMCPSFMASRDESTTTRARANILREFLTNSNRSNPFDHPEIYAVMDLCLSCKGCKSECPSNVDMAKLKAEFLQQYYDDHRIPLRTRLIAYLTDINHVFSHIPGLFNFFVKHSGFSSLIKRMLGFAQKRSIPLLAPHTLRRWAKINLRKLTADLPADAPLVHLFVDEFTNFNDVRIGECSIKLLTRLGYRVNLPASVESGRTFISKGLLRTAGKKAARNIKLLKNLVSGKTPLVGIEPSAILSFRDEYPDFFRGPAKEEALRLAANAFTIEEFLMKEMEEGRITAASFTTETKHIKLHGHCQQKAVASTRPDHYILSFPVNYSLEEIPSGCCGMAGSFGYEREHYDLSMKVGELVLFPEVRRAPESVIIAAPGTSCRHQIKDGTGREALHPVEILYNALI
jgi:FAD/FMN-containing dehydrogenase/Fe-S oxidoreductase